VTGARSIEPPARLQDGPVALRPPEDRDAPGFVRAFADDPGLGARIGVEEDPADEALVRARFASVRERAAAGRGLELAIASAPDDRFLGSLLFHTFAWRDRRCEVGYWLVPQARGRGLGSRAVALGVGWAFGALDLLRVEMTTTSDNAAVDALARRLGFTREGVLRSRAIERVRPVDIVMYAMLRHEWRRWRP
jgi:RimJ/RimL family protein N-acetyltransferase